MANPKWPDGLPPPLIDGASYAPEFDNTIRTQFTGGQKVRRRFSHVPEVVTLQFHCDRAQVQILHDFATITCQDTLPFDWVEHRDPALGLAVYTFRERPKFTPAQSGLYWRASVVLTLHTPFNGTFLLGDGSGGVLTTDDDETLTT